jgi:hypothetical protein
MEGLGGVLDGHLKRQIQAAIINTPLASSIEEIEIKLHFLNLAIAPNGRKSFVLGMVSTARSFSRG